MAGFQGAFMPNLQGLERKSANFGSEKSDSFEGSFLICFLLHF